MSRRIVQTEQEAMADLDVRSRPAWLEHSHSLPFGGLHSDEFEVLCFLLLTRENPSDRVIYYGKTADGGRDIVHVRDGTHELIQCKCYSGRIGSPEIRKELAKLFANVHSGRIPHTPSRIFFYVSTDLTAPATDIINDQTQWTAVARDALELHLGESAPQELIAFAHAWWPEIIAVNGVALTDRLKPCTDLVDEFFRTRAVIRGDISEVRPVLQSVDQRLARIERYQELSLRPEIEKAPKLLQMALEEAERAHPALSFSITVEKGVTTVNVRAKQGEAVNVGQLSFPKGEKGKAGEEKFRRLVDYGVTAELLEGEYDWHRAIVVPGFDNDDAASSQERLIISASMPSRKSSVRLVAGGDDGTECSVDLAYARVVRAGRKELLIQVGGGQFAGTIDVKVPLDSDRGSSFELQVQLATVSARFALATARVLTTLCKGGYLEIRNADTDLPILKSWTDGGFAPLRVWEDSCRVLEYLAIINAKLGLNLRYADFSRAEMNTIRLLAEGIRLGEVGTRAPGPISIGAPREFGEELLAVWKTGEAVGSITFTIDVPFEIGGTAIPVQPCSMTLVNVRPLEDVISLEARISATTDEILIPVSCDFSVHEFPDWKLTS